MRCRKRIILRGIVQGVGFRPFVYRVARRLELTGFARNSSSGLLTEIEGPAEAVADFIQTITSEPPPLARIRGIEVAETPPLGDTAFVIRESLDQFGEFALVSPDIATCDSCRGDFLDPHNRRYGYPFTNCTDCGPRYTIVE